MQEVFNWLLTNWRIVLEVVLLVVSVVILIIKKKPVNSIVTAIYCAAVQAVIVAEKTDLKGRDKLDYCIGLVNASLSSNYPDINVRQYYYTIVNVIEEILSTPQKKGE